LGSLILGREERKEEGESPLTQNEFHVAGLTSSRIALTEWRRRDKKKKRKGERKRERGIAPAHDQPRVFP